MRAFSVLVALALLTSGCADDRVRLTYAPVAGTRSAYAVDVRTTTTTALEGEPARTERATYSLRVQHTVGRDGRVAVRLLGPGNQRRDLVARFDRAGQLSAVESVQGLPASALGDLGLSEVFPASVTEPPGPLSPGDRWRIDTEIALAGATPARLTGSGRLASLGVSDGEELATVETDLRLPVVRASGGGGAGQARIEGVQRTRLRATHQLDDGVLRQAHARTTARYNLTLTPPTPDGGPPVTGTLSVVVVSTTRPVS